MSEDCQWKAALVLLKQNCAANFATGPMLRPGVSASVELSLTLACGAGVIREGWWPGIESPTLQPRSGSQKRSFQCEIAGAVVTSPSSIDSIYRL